MMQQILFASFLLTTLGSPNVSPNVAAAVAKVKPTANKFTGHTQPAGPNVAAAVEKIESTAFNFTDPAQTAPEMEAAITSLMLGKTAFGATPMGGSVKKIKNLLTKDMMPKVLSAHRSDKRMLAKLVKDIEKCGKIKANGFKAGSPPLGKYKRESRLHKSCRRDEAVKLTSLRTCRRQEKSLLKIKKLKCNAFVAVSRKWGNSKNNNIIARRSHC